MSYNLQEEQKNNTVTPVNEVFNTGVHTSTPENVQSTLPIAENSTTIQRATTLAAEYNTSIETAYNSLENTTLQTDANKYLNTLYSLEGNGTLNATSDNDYIMSAALGTNILSPITSATTGTNTGVSTETPETTSTNTGVPTDTPGTTGTIGVYDGETPVVSTESEGATSSTFKQYTPNDIPVTDGGIYDLSEIYKKALDAVQETADTQLEIQKKNGELALEMLQYAANAGISSFEYDWGTLGKGTEYLNTGYSGYSGYYGRGWRRYYGRHWRNYRRWRNYGWRNYSYWGNGYGSYGDSDLYGMNDDAADALYAYIQDGTAGADAWENLSGEQRDEILSYLEYDYPNAGTAYEVLANAIGRMNKENHELFSPTDYNEYGTGLPLELNEDGTPITNTQLNAEWNARHRQDILNPETGIIETYYFDSEKEKNNFNETEAKRQQYINNVTWLDDLKTFLKENSKKGEAKSELMRTKDYWDGEMLAADSGYEQMKLVGKRAGLTKDSLIRSGIAIGNTLTKVGTVQNTVGLAAKGISEFDNKVLGGSLKRDLNTIASDSTISAGGLNKKVDLINTAIDTGINLIGGLTNGKSLGEAYESAKKTASKNESSRKTAKTLEPAKEKVQKDTTTTESGKKTTSRSAMNAMTQARNKADSNKSKSSNSKTKNNSSKSSKSKNTAKGNSTKSTKKSANSSKSKKSAQSKTKNVTKTAQKAAKKIKKAAKDKSSNKKKK